MKCDECCHLIMVKRGPDYQVYKICEKINALGPDQVVIECRGFERSGSLSCDNCGETRLFNELVETDENDNEICPKCGSTEWSAE